MKKRKRQYFFPFRLFFFGLSVSMLYLGGHLLYGEIQSKKMYQKIVDLGNIAYDEDFLKTISKAEGFYSISPVYEIPVKLQWEDYTMDTVFMVLDFEEFKMEGTAAEKLETGNTPILMIGEKELAGFKDRYGNGISEKNIKRFWETKDVQELEYYVTEELVEGTAGNKGDSTQMESIVWRPCLAVGRLSEPSEGIYVPKSQIHALTFQFPLVKKALLTTQGTKQIL